MKKPKEAYVVMKEDLPYIACDVCQKAVASFYKTIADAREKAFKKNLHEFEVVEYLDVLCKPENQTGQWIRRQDIVEEKVSGGRLLRLIEPGELSKCKEECVTIAKSCELLFDEELEERDDFSTALWKNKVSFEEIQEMTCKKWTSRCKNNKNKYLPAKFKRMDKEFEVMSEKDIQMEELMTQMNGAGLGGSMSMYNRDDMANMMGGMGGDMGYGEEDEMYGGMGNMGYGEEPEF